MIQPTRRSFLGLIGVGLAAPLIVRATSIMPVKAMPVGDGVMLTSMSHPELTYKNYTRLAISRTTQGWSLTKAGEAAFESVWLDYAPLHTGGQA
jgi:hypothetical protein